jgi:recombinational DNA repair protein RecT
MVGGWIKLLSQCPGVDGVDAQCVHEADTISVTFDPKQPIDHSANAKLDRGPIVSYWAQARLATGFYVKELMSDRQLEMIRQHSPAPDSPAWRDWRDQMGLKAALKRLAKRLPRWRDPIANAVSLPSLPTDDERAYRDPEVLTSLESDALIAIAETGSAEELQQTWVQIVSEFANRGAEPPAAVFARFKSRSIDYGLVEGPASGGAQLTVNSC